MSAFCCGLISGDRVITALLQLAALYGATGGPVELMSSAWVRETEPSTLKML